MKSNVYFIDLRATAKENLVAKLARLLDTAGLSQRLEHGHTVAPPRRLVRAREAAGAASHDGDLLGLLLVRECL